MGEHGTDNRPINVLLIGGGGREHALALAISRSPRLGRLFTSHPENPGLAALAKPVDCPVSGAEMYRLVQFCDRNEIGLVVVGPEEPLALGFADTLATEKRLVFGPGAEGARLESDKAWARQLLRGASVPMGEGRAFSDAQAAIGYILSRPQPPVVKATGLAKGKGVVVASSTAEACDAVKRIMVDRVFGEAGRTVVLEERLTGREVSVLAITDGRSILILPPAQDYKRLGDGDTGPNTGGMGALCPADTLDEGTMARVEREILVPTVDALKREGIDYRGVLYAGLMLTPAGPKVLEFNCRFGDPECQVILARLASDVLELLLAACTRRLGDAEVRWRDDHAVCVVLASEGYPETPRAGVVVEGLDEASAVEGVQVLHAGTRRLPDGRVVTSGGRVLNVVGVGPTRAEARRRAYEGAGKVRLDGARVRRDIGSAGPPSLEA